MRHGSAATRKLPDWRRPEILVGDVLMPRLTADVATETLLHFPEQGHSLGWHSLELTSRYRETR